MEGKVALEEHFLIEKSNCLWDAEDEHGRNWAFDGFGQQPKSGRFRSIFQGMDILETKR